MRRCGGGEKVDRKKGEGRRKEEIGRDEKRETKKKIIKNITMNLRHRMK
jgi:hypothetical protein